MRKEKEVKNQAIASASENKTQEPKSIVNPAFARTFNEKERLLERLESSIRESDNKGGKPPKQFSKYSENYFVASAIENGLFLKSSVHDYAKRYVLSLRADLINEYKISLLSSVVRVAIPS